MNFPLSVVGIYNLSMRRTIQSIFSAFKVGRTGFSSTHQVTPEFVSRLDLERVLKGHEVRNRTASPFARKLLRLVPVLHYNMYVVSLSFTSSCAVNKIFVDYGLCRSNHELCFLIANTFNQGCVNCIEWNRAGSLLASGSDDFKLIVWRPFSRDDELVQKEWSKIVFEQYISLT